MIRELGSIGMAALALAVVMAPARAAEIRVMSAGAVEQVLRELSPAFTRESGHTVVFTFDTVGATRAKIEGGEVADVVILSVAAIEALEKAGLVVSGSRTDIGRAAIGVAVREGSPLPDISTPEAFKKALLDARSVAFTDPAAGGSAGTYFAGLLERMGIADAVKAKALPQKRGTDVAKRVAAGEAEIGITFISEILPVKGASVVGPLPASLQNYTTYAAAIPIGRFAREAARTFINMLTRPTTVDLWKSAGFDPPRGAP